MALERAQARHAHTPARTRAAKAAILAVCCILSGIGARSTAAETQHLKFDANAAHGLAAEVYGGGIAAKVLEHRRKIHSYPERTYDEYEVRQLHSVSPA